MEYIVTNSNIAFWGCFHTGSHGPSELYLFQNFEQNDLGSRRDYIPFIYLGSKQLRIEKMIIGCRFWNSLLFGGNVGGKL